MPALFVTSNLFIIGGIIKIVYLDWVVEMNWQRGKEEL